MSRDLIIGMHSIAAVLQNENRSDLELYCTDEAQEDFFKKYPALKKFEGLQVNLMASHKLQETAKGFYADRKWNYSRVPSNMFLLSNEINILSNDDVLSILDDEETPQLKILCLDQVSDVHNAAAILRTASFYGVEYLVVSQKGSFGLTPSFYRIASGATEHVKIVQVSNLSRFITQILKRNVLCVGLSEHAEKQITEETMANNENSLCLILGAEETGLSNAVMRAIDNTLVLDSQGAIKSLNVSVAAAVAMEKCFSKK